MILSHYQTQIKDGTEEEGIQNRRATHKTLAFRINAIFIYKRGCHGLSYNRHSEKG